jgi:hypothetical protein
MSTCSGLYPSDDLPVVVEEEGDRRDAEMRPDALGDSVLVPILVGTAGDVQSQHDQIRVEVSENISDSDNLILISDSSPGLKPVCIHMVKDPVQALVCRNTSATNV